MAAFDHALETILHLLIQLGNLVLAGIVAVEVWLRSEMTLMNVPHQIQTVLLVAMAALLVVAALRLFGGLIRLAVVLILILVAIHVLLPVIQT